MCERVDKGLAVSLIVVIGLLVSYFLHPIPLQGANVDLGHHLLFGQIITDTRHVFDNNLVSYTHPEYKFVNSQWLAEVVFYNWHKVFGFDGLIVLGAILISVAYSLIYIPAVKKYGWYSGLITSLVYIQLLMDRTEVKPEIFSWILLAIFLNVLLKYQAKYTKWIWILIPLQVLWVNFHIYYFVANFMLAMLLIDFVVFRKLNFKDPFVTNLFWVNLGCGLATLANPNFITGALYPLFVLSNYGYKVIENQNFFYVLNNYGNITFAYFGLAVLVVCFFIIKNYRKISKFEIGIVMFFIFMSVYAVRDFPLFLFGSLTLVIREIALLKNKFLILFLIIIFVLPGIERSFKIHSFGLGTIDYASNAIQIIKDNRIRGPIYNNYNIGNFLEYKIYPSERVFVDGNPEEYPKEFFENFYYPSEKSFSEFERISKIYNFNVIFYDHVNQTESDNPVLSGLIKSDKWRLVYLNYGIVMFVKNIPENSQLIEVIDVGNNDSVDPNRLRSLSNIYRVFGWYEKMYEMDMKLLDYEPNNCVALRHVTAMMKQAKHPQLPIYANKYLQKCNF